MSRTSFKLFHSHRRLEILVVRCYTVDVDCGGTLQNHCAAV